MKTCRALASFPFSPDRIRVRSLADGDIFACEDGVAEALIKSGLAADCEPPESKDAGAAPENKDAGAAPATRAKRPARRKG